MQQKQLPPGYEMEQMSEVLFLSEKRRSTDVRWL